MFINFFIIPAGVHHLIADMQQAQLLMVAGFVMLGWVLARRQIKLRRRTVRNVRAADRAIQQIRDHKDPAVPLADAPPETQRWQVAMFDLQRELKAELDTRIVIVQTLLKQVDQRIERLTALHAGGCPAGTSRVQERQSATGQQRDHIQQLLRSGRTAEEIAAVTRLTLGDVQRTIADIGSESN